MLERTSVKPFSRGLESLLGLLRSLRLTLCHRKFTVAFPPCNSTHCLQGDPLEGTFVFSPDDHIRWRASMPRYRHEPNPRNRRAVNRWAARVIPVLLAGAVGYCTYVIVSPLCSKQSKCTRLEHLLTSTQLTIFYTSNITEALSYPYSSYTSYC